MLDQHIDRENNGDMSVSDLDEVLRMESFFWDWAFKCLPLLRGPIWGILGLERRHEIWLLYVPPIDEYGYRSKVVRTIKMFLSFLSARRSIAIDVAKTNIRMTWTWTNAAPLPPARVTANLVDENGHIKG